MLEQIKLDACYLFEVERSDKDGVKYAMTMYLLAIGVFTLIFGVAGLVAPFVIEWVRSRSRAKKKSTSAPADAQPKTQPQKQSKELRI